MAFADNFNQLIDPKSPYKLAVMQADYLYFMAKPGHAPQY
jgi:hypothetical protein